MREWGVWLFLNTYLYKSPLGGDPLRQTNDYETEKYTFGRRHSLRDDGMSVNRKSDDGNAGRK